MKMDPATGRNRAFFERLHVDLPLLLGLLVLMLFGLVVMYSASGQSLDMMDRQAMRMLMSLLVMLGLAQLSPRSYERLAPLLFFCGALLLLGVLFFGETSKGAQRWLNFGFVRFQPSELLKLAVPLMVARYIGNRPIPANLTTITVSLLMVCFPTILIAKQPDLGTAILIAASGIFVIFLAGISWKIIAAAAVGAGAFIPVLWFFIMHEYQKTRVRTLFDPESDPLGAGYHIIQSKIAIGSGGISGKGWLHGTQSNLEFLPERHTDFIFAVIAEEWGMIGILALLSVYLFIIGRGLYLASNAQTAFGRMMAGSIVLSFFVYVFVNIGMVSGILPVVGVPLPLISYGGTSMVTLMAGFGILMSIHTHRKAFSKAN
ncbi:rod shape-determining protein RodA [Vibrio cincinnatiensis]|uniref:Peptidoglycan glycosyltransferase MrdB n=1 Tax=Vibrio cincinnatiensis DSM 19608 TaxID=1123491 RepID=A0A1T4PL12_VIBCI|nr:rod shape-determining protein RodA [Vibrio cincinnatiensis]MCG3726471.1 rod shape-determining protein RodA [Vibrio cincinnatiensis]MCG3731858.1 rod shape-determining protein RodA [Vibrio cincinnatiensis]MCG3739554.1 rod shape-determining protein RodA [Vibrio cincinnatiensis]MCG3742073.1 rod shape-determining protein RodA [Vibrio cincinnatiensis]SJZ92240.1 cell elongation-specific peptidoglycan biosynthesis regulator RodA [Vibrio cincinnatiensis DSM 19608]